MENTKTKGEEVIGTFNSNNLTEINELKQAAIHFINLIDKYGKDPRRKAKAITDIETGMLFAIKSLFTD